MRRFIASAGFLLLTTFVAQSVPAAESSPSRGVIEEIVVTAQKREQNIQDVGISMAAYSSDQLQSLGIDGIEGLAGDIPNVQLFELSGGGVPIVVIRGVGLNNFRINDSPTTGVYVDEVYQVSIAQLGSTLFDIERVEVLKGPQGGLYGRNAVGGAIRYLSKKPSFEQNESYASVGYGRFAKREVEGGFGGPISDVLAARISGRMVKSDDTVFESPIGGFDHGEEDRWAARAMFSFQPSDTFSLDLKLHGGGDQSELPLMRPIGAYEPGVPTFIPGVISSRLAGDFCSSLLTGGREPGRCVLTSGETPESLGVNGRYDGATLRRPRLDSDWWGLNLIGVWASDNYTVKSITAYDKLDYLRRTDQDAGPLAQQEITYVSDIGSWSQELHVTYDAGGAVTGLFGFTYSQDTLEETTFLDGSEGLFTFVFGTDSVENPYEQDTQAFAAFGRVDWMFADDWNVGVEARYTTEDKEFSGGTFFVDQGNFINRTTGQTIFTDDDTTSNAGTGKVVVEWEQSPDLLLYGSIARGFKTGGFFGGFALSLAELEAYDSEFILAYEVGAKSEWFDGRARINGALFYYDRTDVQAGGSVTTAGVTINRLTNIGDVETYGAELEMTIVPVDRLTLSLNLGYTKAEIVDTNVVDEDIFSGVDISLEGVRLPIQPEFSLNFFGHYEFPLTDDISGGVQLEYSYRSEFDMKFVKSPQEAAFLTEDGYGLLNLKLSVISHGGDWELSGRIDNLTGKEYRSVARDVTHGGAYEIWGEPRIWSVRLSKNWD